MKMYCPNCHWVYGTATLRLEYSVSIGNQGVERTEFDKMTNLSPRISLTCSECHNLSRDTEMRFSEDPQALRARIFDLLLNDYEEIVDSTYET